MTAAVAVLAVLAVFLGGTMQAAGQARPVRIGALTESWGPTPAFVGVRDGLVKLGYREHEDFVIGVRFTQGNLEALRDAARELVEQRPDILLVSLGAAANAVAEATSRIPIVLAGAGDPVRSGLVQSLARPGGNITGVTGLGPELSAKRLELFRDAVPQLRRVLFVYHATDPLALMELDQYRDAARRLGLLLIERPVTRTEEARAVIAGASRSEADGLLASEPVGLNIPGMVLEMASRMPTMFPNSYWTERGGLASYSADYYASGRQAARLVDKIIKGAQPGELPVEANPRIEFVLNRKVARQLVVNIPPAVLLRADRLIE